MPSDSESGLAVTDSGRAGRPVMERVPLSAADVLTVAEAAELLRMPKSTVADLARRGVIPSKKLGRRRIILRPELERLLFHRGA